MDTLIKHKVIEIQWPGKTFLAKREKISFDQLTDFFTRSYGEIYGQLLQAGVTAHDMPCAIYYSIDETRGITDVAAAVPVINPIPEAEGLKKIVIPASKALMVTHYGPYEEMGSAYAELEEYVFDHQLKKDWMLEEYFSDPNVEKDPSTWKTNIYFIIH